MKILHKLVNWLEKYGLNPSYGGWVLLVLSICFFAAASNTMSGWLYVISGLIIAILSINGVIARRSLKALQIHRQGIEPVSAGDDLTLRVEVENLTATPKTLIQIEDFLPYVLAEPKKWPIDVIPPYSRYQCEPFYIRTRQRGIYRWHDIDVTTASPLGLMGCRRSQEVHAKAIVYPQILTLFQCPLVDTLGRDESTKTQSDHRYQTATEGVTRTLRPYRYGDPMRLVHWRTSARFGEFKVRELEIITGGEDVIIALDSGQNWNRDAFEKAVIVAASLYFYAGQCQMNAKLWTAGTGIIQGNRLVLETLAAVEAEEETTNPYLPELPLIWLTANLPSLETLPPYSRWVFFPAREEDTQPVLTRNFSGLVINEDEPLEQQLQNPLG